MDTLAGVAHPDPHGGHCGVTVNPYPATLIYLNFQPLEVVDRYRDPQPQPQAIKTHWPDIAVMLVRHRRRWANITAVSGQRPVFAMGIPWSCFHIWWAKIQTTIIEYRSLPSKEVNGSLEMYRIYFDPLRPADPLSGSLSCQMYLDVLQKEPVPRDFQNGPLQPHHTFPGRVFHYTNWAICWTSRCHQTMRHLSLRQCRVSSLTSLICPESWPNCVPTGRTYRPGGVSTVGQSHRWLPSINPTLVYYLVVCAEMEVLSTFWTKIRFKIRTHLVMIRLEINLKIKIMLTTTNVSFGAVATLNRRRQTSIKCCDNVVPPPGFNKVVCHPPVTWLPCNNSTSMIIPPNQILLQISHCLLALI